MLELWRGVGEDDMTLEQASELLPLIEAFLNDDLQIREFVKGKKTWIDVLHGDTFGLVDIDHSLKGRYRIRPKSRTKQRYA